MSRQHAPLVYPDAHAETSVMGGRAVRWWRRPGSGPTVMFLSGCGMAMEFWGQVVDLLPGRGVASYDRPGLGGTPWPGHLPTLDEEVGTLVDLLRGMGGPVVLVAHSMAAFHAEALTRAHPDLVAGVVLVDPSVEWPWSPPNVSSARPSRALGSMVSSLRLSALGPIVTRVMVWAQSNQRLTHEVAAKAPRRYNDPNALAMALAESTAYGRQSWDLMISRARFPWPDTPASVLSADKGEERRHRGGQLRLARSLHAEYSDVEHSRHFMMLDRPDAVADAVRRVTAAVPS